MQVSLRLPKNGSIKETWVKVTGRKTGCQQKVGSYARSTSLKVKFLNIETRIPLFKNFNKHFTVTTLVGPSKRQNELDNLDSQPIKKARTQNDNNNHGSKVIKDIPHNIKPIAESVAETKLKHMFSQNADSEMLYELRNPKNSSNS
ncbi:unnamed protein product [Parnassius apollo]|uniref:(apollo) hypothetical protein n=1 Tax=Parnassius apollo TaxID=110799 RepID=A0A8S3WRH3_PARAO|nr:unnamed protein product [Parnassius apollo]